METEPCSQLVIVLDLIALTFSLLYKVSKSFKVKLLSKTPLAFIMSLSEEVKGGCSPFNP
jgi:hypothetical protein